MLARLVFALAVIAAAFAPGLSAPDAAEAKPGGTFRATCNPSHVSTADPIVKPGPDDAHLHQFFGNTTTNQDSTYASLQAGTTKCERGADKSAYWMPVISKDYRIIEPFNTGVYYQSVNGVDETKTQVFPNGFRMITNAEKADVRWHCGMNDHRLSEMTATPPEACADGTMGVRIDFPECWDGNVIPDPTGYNVVQARPWNGIMVCPTTYPVQLPTIVLFVNYPTFGTEPGTVRISAPNGTWRDAAYMHADFVNGWDRNALSYLIRTCINETDQSEPRPAHCG